MVQICLQILAPWNCQKKLKLNRMIIIYRIATYKGNQCKRLQQLCGGLEKVICRNLNPTSEAVASQFESMFSRLLGRNLTITLKLTLIKWQHMKNIEIHRTLKVHMVSILHQCQIIEINHFVWLEIKPIHSGQWKTFK